jgi:hypothetical protein
MFQELQPNNSNGIVDDKDDRDDKFVSVIYNYRFYSVKYKCC